MIYLLIFMKKTYQKKEEKMKTEKMKKEKLFQKFKKNGISFQDNIVLHKIIKKIQISIRFIFLGSLLFGSASEAVTSKEIIYNIGHRVILQTYLDFASKTGELSSSINEFAKNPNEENLEKSKKMWRNARIPWESSEAFLFGPVDSLGIDPQVDTWPLNRLDLELIIKSGRTLDVDFVRNLGTNLQGYHTIEYLLFGNGLTSNNKPLSAFNNIELQYLESTAILLAEYAQNLANAWSKQYNPEDPQSPGYVEIVTLPSLQNPIYNSERAVLGELIRGMIQILDEVGNGKISDPFGSDIDHANVELDESPYAWNSLADFSNNLRSVLSIYTGAYGNSKGPGIKDFVAQKNIALAQKIEFEILKSIQLIQKIAGENSMPFRQAILNVDGRKRVQQAIEQISKTRQLMEQNILPLIEN